MSHGRQPQRGCAIVENQGRFLYHVGCCVQECFKKTRMRNLRRDGLS